MKRGVSHIRSVHPPPPAESNQHRARSTSLQVAIPATSAWPLAALGSANGSVLLWDMRAPPIASVPWRCRISPLTTTPNIIHSLTAPTHPSPPFQALCCGGTGERPLLPTSPPSHQSLSHLSSPTHPSPPPGAVLLWDKRAPSAACVPWRSHLSPLTNTTIVKPSLTSPPARPPPLSRRCAAVGHACAPSSSVPSKCRPPALTTTAPTSPLAVTGFS
ncbi:unnamed protein product [Closterium sp. NIES-64]|nr:unnamed protein product [Closterium sp. NIES-64]